MDTTHAGRSEQGANAEEPRANEQSRRSGRVHTRRAVRVLLGVEGASFLLAAAVHAGWFVSGYAHREAMTAETVLGAALLGGLLLGLVRPRSTFTIGALVQAFALVGTLVGVVTMVVGVGPQTVPDIVYHVVIVVVLAVGLVSTWRARRVESR